MEPTTAKCCGRRRRTALLLLILLLSVTATAAQHVVVAYVTSWSSGLPDPTRMTHINYAFGGVNSARTGVSISNASRLQQIVALKRRNPELKVLLSIGGWGAGGFTPMTSDATKRMAFARDCLRVCQQYGLDGIDLDWEFPGNNSSGESSPTGEKQNYSLLCRDLRQVLGADYLLTMASNYTPGNYDFRGCIQYLDFVNVMCYNMASPPNHHAALYKGGGPVNNGYYSCQMAMNDHINAGIPRQKLVMGMPLYGHESGRGEQSYQRARDLLATGNYVEDWDDRGKVPWIKKKSDGSFYMDFENQRSIEYKCRYILGQKFLGGMYWDYHSDDNQGTLRNTIYKLLLLGETDDPVVRLDGEQMLPDGFRRYSWDGSLTQGQTLRIELEQSDITLQPDEDFFAPQTDGSLRFLPIDGRYRIRADLDLRFLSVEALDADGQPATLQTDGSGAIWLIGSQGVGKPTFETAGHAWDAEEGPLCLAQLKAKNPPDHPARRARALAQRRQLQVFPPTRLGQRVHVRRLPSHLSLQHALCPGHRLQWARRRQHLPALRPDAARGRRLSLHHQLHRRHRPRHPPSRGRHHLRAPAPARGPSAPPPLVHARLHPRLSARQARDIHPERQEGEEPRAPMTPQVKGFRLLFTSETQLVFTYLLSLFPILSK